MRFLFLALAFTAIVSSSSAETKEFVFANFEQASVSPTFIRFDMESTKLGLLTTSFTGFVLGFKLNGVVEGNLLRKDASIEFNSRALDTNINARNEKMWDQSLGSDLYPKIVIELNEAVSIDGLSYEVPATINIRGSKHNLKLSVKAKSESGVLVFDFTGTTSLKGLSIPDPSILIATVRDRIDLKCHIEVAAK